MTWDDWTQWAKKQRKRTSWSMVLEVAPPWHHQLEELELVNRQSIDEKILFYCQHRKWPRMTALQRCLIYYRMEYVEGIVGILGKSHFPPPANDHFADTIEWLLIKSWYSNGCHRWMEYLRLCRIVGEIDAIKNPPVLPENPEEGFAT